MTENNEITPEELPEEQASESPADGGMMEIEVGGKPILSEVAMDAPKIRAHPEANVSETPDESVASEEEMAEVKEPTRFQLFLRKALIWFGIVLAFFLAGFAAAYFQLYRPQVVDSEEQLQTITDLRAEIVELEATRDTLEYEATIDEVELQHKALLMVMVDVYDARYALGEEDLVEAKSALSGTDASLNMVLADIREFDSGLAETLPQRLDLIR
ncbi:MAG: hypothetical protein ACK2T7_02670, partial [Anaerolineales bacterium]